MLEKEAHNRTGVTEAVCAGGWVGGVRVGGGEVWGKGIWKRDLEERDEASGAAGWALHPPIQVCLGPKRFRQCW